MRLFDVFASSKTAAQASVMYCLSPRCLTERLEPRVLLASVPAGFTDSLLADELNNPTAMDIAPDGRIFVALQGGKLLIIDGDQTLNPLTIPSVDATDERGFDGIKLDPNFSTNGFVYVYYTRINGTGASGRNNRIARYTFSGNSVVGTEAVVLDLPDIQNAVFHMGGALHFGPDGKLYVGVGDHLDFSAPQDLSNVFGKVLRINANGSIPTDNPFYAQTTGINRAIWARGLRNPFTIAFQPGTGRMFINDVGQEAFEEVNLGEPGANYGWPDSEGPNNSNGFDAPIYYYESSGENCAITGGVFYNPQSPNFPNGYVGQYFFGDLCGGYIRTLDPDTLDVGDFATGLSFMVDLDVGPDGSLLYLQRGTDINSGSIGRIRFGNEGAPTLLRQPSDQTVARGSTATFVVQAGGTAPLSYQWQKDAQDISGATAATLTLANVQDDDAGAYRVRVSNSLGTVTSSTAQLTVQSGTAPVAVIDTPKAGARFRGGQTFNFAGHATDTEDGTLGPSRFTWRVDYHTGSVVRPFLPEFSGSRSGTFTVNTETPYKAADVFYRIILTVRDSSGRTHTVTRDLKPVTAQITINSNIAGVTVDLDGQPKSLPLSTTGVAGVKRILSAPQTQTIGGQTYVFDGWSDGGDREHYVLTPTSDVVYTARYRRAPANSVRGLGMTIHNNRDRTGTVITRNVATIDFDWGAGSPSANIHPDTFFVRFRGYVQPLFSEAYTFYLRADDRARLYIDNQILIDGWLSAPGTELSATIALTAGQKHDLRYDYIEDTGNAQARLEWSSPSTPRSVIPRARLLSRVLEQNFLATADSYVQNGTAANANFGKRGTLWTRNSDADSARREAYLKFDFTGMDLETLGRAKLRIFGRLTGDRDINVTTGLYSAPGASWSETGIKWNNRPAAAASPIATVDVTDDHNQFWEFDITQFLRDQFSRGRRVLTFVLKNLDASDVYSMFYSRENSINAPQVVVSA